MSRSKAPSGSGLTLLAPLLTFGRNAGDTGGGEPREWFRRGIVVDDAPDGRRGQADHADRRVLLVDDDPGILETLSPFFRIAGFEVAVARTGTAAVELGKSRAFAVCVCDLRLPDVTGLDVLRELRAAGSRAPFVVISGYATVEVTVQAMKLGAADVISKPVDGDRLVQLVRGAIETDVPRPSMDVAPEAAPASERAGATEGPLAAIRRTVAAMVADEASMSDERRVAVLRTLARGMVRREVNVWQFLACTEALRAATAASGAEVGAQVKRAVLDALERGAAARPALHDERVSQALAMLGALDGSGLRLSEHDLGRVVGLSDSHLGRLLVKHTGLRFRTLRRAFRVQHGARLLAETDEHVRQIAYRVGYEDERQFNREFHKVFGLCPRRFRELLDADQFEHFVLHLFRGF